MSGISRYVQGLPPSFRACPLASLHHLAAALLLAWTTADRISCLVPGLDLAERCLAVMLHHLREHKIGELPAMAEQHLLDLGIRRDIAAHPRDDRLPASS